MQFEYNIFCTLMVYQGTTINDTTIFNRRRFQKRMKKWLRIIVENGGNGETHCLGINYYVNFFGGWGSNEFHIKWIFGIQDKWKN